MARCSRRAPARTPCIASSSPPAIPESFASSGICSRRSGGTSISQAELNVPSAEEPHLDLPRERAREGAPCGGGDGAARARGRLGHLRGRAATARRASCPRASPANRPTTAATTRNCCAGWPTPTTGARITRACSRPCAASDDPEPLIADARWHGEVLDCSRAARGGFGYDPLFLLPDLGKTAAELDPAEKNRISHRGQAMAELARKMALNWA